MGRTRTHRAFLHEAARFFGRVSLPPTANTQETSRRRLNLQIGCGQQNKSKGILRDFDLRCCLPSFQTPAQAGFLGGAPETALSEIQEAASVGDVTARTGTHNQLPAPLCQTGTDRWTQQRGGTGGIFNLSVQMKKKRHAQSLLPSVVKSGGKLQPKARGELGRNCVCIV